jgi:hypothetical protein
LQRARWKAALIHSRHNANFIDDHILPQSPGGRRAGQGPQHRTATQRKQSKPGEERAAEEERYTAGKARLNFQFKYECIPIMKSYVLGLSKRDFNNRLKKISTEA